MPLPLNRSLRLFHTVRYLKPRQIGWRLYYRLLRRCVRRQAMVPLSPTGIRSWHVAWVAPAWMPPCMVGANEFEFLGERGSLASAEDWQHPARSKLWLYNLHYLDDLSAREAEVRFGAHRDLVARWMDENPPLIGNGWEPYALSLRLVNLVKWLGGPAWQDDKSVPTAWRESLARQAQALSAQREYHILANHLFANGKALTFVGAFLDGDAAERWLSQGLAILDAEIPEQFLADGGHFERSPMYHATLLWDLADLINLAECSGLPALYERAPAWRERLSRGLAWLMMMTHSDGEIGFFNDAAFGIAPTLADLQCYAERLGVGLSTKASLERQVVTSFAQVEQAEPSGYMAVSWGQGGKALLDIAPVGPDYQPGHAHADTLSFELSLFGQRVLVNSGTSQYGEDAERHRQRGTVAHNTVTVEVENSSEVWAGFRVARRARPGPCSVDDQVDGLSIAGSHDGYRRLPGKVVHHRAWRFLERAFSVHDHLEGSFQHAEARFHCHPSVSVTLHDPCHGTLVLPDGREVAFVIGGGEAWVKGSDWHPRFGEPSASRCLAVQLIGPSCITSFTWPLSFCRPFPNVLYRENA